MDISTDNKSIPLIQVYFDGLCQPVNPGGIACYAFVAKRNGETIHSDYGVAGDPFSSDATNNVAEYTALIKALEWLLANNFSSNQVEIIGDSEFVVNQQNGKYKVKSKRILPFFHKVLMLKGKFSKINIRHVPREENKEADRLTNVAYNEFLQNNVEYLDRVAELEKRKKINGRSRTKDQAKF
jgi:ribonuclease HI